MIIVQSEVIDNEEISEKLDDALQTAMRDNYWLFTNIRMIRVLTSLVEIEQMEIEYSVAQYRVQQCTHGCTKACTTT